MNATKRKFNNLIQNIGTPRSSTTPQPPNDGLSSNSRPTTAEGDPLSALSRIPSSTSATSAPRPQTPVMTENMASGITATPMSAISADFLSKRRRVGTPGLAPGDANVIPSKMTITNITMRKWTPTGKGSEASRLDSPKYCPGDREQLIRRLGTFQELTQWTPKPDKVNEIEWAKRGWVCRGKETVQCTLCHKEAVVKMSKKEADGRETPVLGGSELEQALVKRFAELIIDAHQDDCLWRKRGCDDSLLRLQITSAQTALPALRERYDELCSRPAFLPYFFNLRLPEALHLETIKSQLPPKFFTEPPPAAASTTNSKETNDVALALALAGWSGLTNPKIGPVPNSASCSTCQRRLGLWMFKSKEVDPETRQVLVPAPMDHLDPVREHRFFCPWRSPEAQRNPGSKAAEPSRAAWEVLAATIKNAAYLRGDTPKKDNRKSWRAGKDGKPRGHAPTASQGTIDSLDLPDSVNGDEDDEKARDAKDKERWARLRRVKSIFNTKDKLRRSLSRPGTAKSTATTGTTGDGAKD
ncbi:3'(2'),5'-bisphosphate nucleotidase [Pestalotiopsis sp. IQ-011]